MKILFVDIDTLRPDHLGCYGYARNTSPNIDRVAEEGVRFDQYYCSDAPCLPSRAALTTGRFGIRNGAVGHGGTAADRRLTGPERGTRDEQDAECFAHIFRRAGLYTASISTFPERHSSWWFNSGFNECFNQGDRGMESGEWVTPYVLSWLEGNALSREDWFLHIHYWDPHTPYRAPEAFGNPFEKEPLEKCFWVDQKTLEAHQRVVGPHTANELNMFNDAENPNLPRNPGSIHDMDGLKKEIDGYDCGVAYMDQCLGQVFDKLRELGIYEETAVIISSDHGENFGELGIYGEHGTADYATCRIPMIIKWPGVSPGRSDAGLHYSLDLLPTLCDLLQVEKAQSWDGESFAKALTAGEPQGRESLVLSQMAHVCQRSARFGDWLYIRTIHDGFRLLPKEMLFNLKEDPHETQNLAEAHPELCAKGAKIILDFVDEEMLKSESDIDPMWTVIREGGPAHAHNRSLGVYEKRLRDTGRNDAADELVRRHATKVPKPLPMPESEFARKILRTYGKN